ncbi:MAG: tRNA lysidine(34) synthetase TilS [Clostridia bacterium]
MKNNRFVKLLSNFLTIDDTVAVAVSGGIDSMVLLHAFTELKKISPINFFVLNIEHGIRGEASRKDSAFVFEYCKQLGVECFSESVDVLSYVKEKCCTVEEGARAVRYSIFNKYVSLGKCNKVALAHHMSDQAETVLMRIIRGTGLLGLCGMRAVSGVYIRPFLEVRKEEIIAYQEANNIPFIVDETNLDNNYTRNLLRNKIIPELSKLSTDVEGSLVRLSRLADEAESYIFRHENPIEVTGEVASFDLIDEEPTLLYKRRVRRCFEALGVKKDVEEVHYDLIDKLRFGENGQRLDMPNGITVYREYEHIVFSKEKRQNIDFNIPFCIGKIGFGAKTLIIGKYEGEQIDDGILLFDITKIPEMAVFRFRRDGDIFTKFGGGTKKLGDYLTDKKVPLRIRDSLIVCAVDNDVLFVAGVEISHKVRVDFGSEEGRKNIYKITLED